MCSLRLLRCQPFGWREGRGSIRTRDDVQSADLRSEQRGRQLVAAASAKAAAKQFQRPELAERALNYHAAHIIREQENREAVLQIAAGELTKNPPASELTTEIDDDWLTAMFKEASTRSSEEFCTLFGRILAGEVKQPETFSIGTVQSVGRLNQSAAANFQKACNISSVFVGVSPPKIIADPFGSADENSLEPFGLNYDNLANLVETGLLRYELNEWREIWRFFVTHRVVFDHAGQSFWFLAEGADNSSIPSLLPTLRLTGPSFSQIGTELRSVVNMEVSEEYIAKLAGWLKERNTRLYRAVGKSGNQGQLVEPAV